MPDFTESDSRALYKAHERLDTMSEIVVELRTQNKYQEQRIKQNEDIMTKHMTDEEKMWDKMQRNFDSLVRFKWIALGVIGTLLVATSDNPVVSKIVESVLK